MNHRFWRLRRFVFIAAADALGIGATSFGRDAIFCVYTYSGKPDGGAGAPKAVNS